MDPDEQNLALSQGLLGLGAGLLSGSFGNYGAFAPALGKGVAGFQQGYSNSIDQNLKLKLFKQNQLLQNAQIQNYQSEVDKRTKDQAELERIRKLALGADGFAGGTGGSASAGGPLSPTPATQPILSSPQITAPPVGPGATALAGGAGPVGGGAGYGATGATVPGAASSVPVNPNAPQLAANGDQVLPPVNVTGKSVSNLLNPDWHMARAEYLYKNGDPKGAVEAVTRAQQLRAEERGLTKDDESKPLEGVPGIAYNPKTGKYMEDGHEVTAAHVQDVKRDLAAAGATKVVNTLTQSAEKSYGTAFGGKIADADAALRDAAMAAPQNAERANRILDLVNSGKIISGSGATYRLALGKALGLAGLSDKDTIAKTEGLTSELASATLDSIKTSGLGSGQGFTDKDRDFLEKAKSGNITLESATLSRLAELNHKAATASADKWNGRVKMIPKSALEGTGLTQDPIVVPPMRGKGTKAMIPQGWSIEEVK